MQRYPAGVPCEAQRFALSYAALGLYDVYLAPLWLSLLSEMLLLNAATGFRGL